MRFTADTLDHHARRFELPEYKGIPVKVPRVEVTRGGNSERRFEKMRQKPRHIFPTLRIGRLSLAIFAVIDYATIWWIISPFVGSLFPGSRGCLSGGNDFLG